MRIEDIRNEQLPGARRTAATIIWEDRQSRPQTVYYETFDPGADWFSASPDTFALAALPLALWYRERRLHVHGSLCPRLHDGMRALLDLFRIWEPDRPLLTIEPAEGFQPRSPRQERRALLFLSGGFDSLALLRANRLEFPLDHPASFPEGIFLFGLNNFDFNGDTPVPERVAAFAANAARLRELGARYEFGVTEIATNVRTLYPDFATWGRMGWATGAFGVAHALAARATEVWNASGGTGPNPEEPQHAQTIRSHYLSSSAVELHVGQLALSRYEKIRMIADWPDALARVRCCLYFEVPANGQINCGRCEKCVRTMLALLSLGKLRECAAFPYDDLTPEMLGDLRANTAGHASYYEESVAQLHRIGRADLAEPLQEKVDDFRRRSVRPTGWKRWLR